MKPGKLDPERLREIIGVYRGSCRDEVLLVPSIGEDCSVLRIGSDLAILSTDPITGASKNAGRLAVIVACNDVAACGGEPLGILVTILCPIGSDEGDFARIMSEVDIEAKAHGVQVLGGHSEVTAAVNTTVISTTVIGRPVNGRYITSSGAKCGDSIIVTKALGLEGTAILAEDCSTSLRRALPEALLIRAKGFIDELSVLREGMAAASGRVSAMHDITEGGILGALYEVTQASSVGYVIDVESLPIREETRRICETALIDPLRLISSGSMLICTDDPDGTLSLLEDAGVEGCVVGEITASTDCVILMNGRRILSRAPGEEQLYAAIERLSGSA